MGNNIDVKEVAKMLVYMGEKHNEISTRVYKGHPLYSDMRSMHYYVENIKNTLNSFDKETRALILAEVESMEREAGKEVKIYGTDCAAGKTQSACNTVITTIVALEEEMIVVDSERGSKPYSPKIDMKLNLSEMQDYEAQPDLVTGGKEITGVEGLKPLYDDPNLTLYAPKHKDPKKNLNAQKELKNVEVVDENAKRIEQYLNAKKYNMDGDPIEELDEILRTVDLSITNLGSTNEGTELPGGDGADQEPNTSAPNESAGESAPNSPDSMCSDGTDAL